MYLFFVILPDIFTLFNVLYPNCNNETLLLRHRCLSVCYLIYFSCGFNTKWRKKRSMINNGCYGHTFDRWQINLWVTKRQSFVTQPICFFFKPICTEPLATRARLALERFYLKTYFEQIDLFLFSTRRYFCFCFT